MLICKYVQVLSIVQAGDHPALHNADPLPLTLCGVSNLMCSQIWRHNQATLSSYRNAGRGGRSFH